MVLPLAGRAVVTAAGGEPRFVKAPHGILVASLKCQMDVRSGTTIVAQRIDPQLVALEVSLVVRTDRFAQRAEHGAIEALRSSEIRRPQVNVIDQPADVDLAHGPLR